MHDTADLFQFLYFSTSTMASCNATQIKIKVIVVGSRNFSSVTINLSALLIY